jgi:hypothetical protein
MINLSVKSLYKYLYNNKNEWKPSLYLYFMHHIEKNNLLINYINDIKYIYFIKYLNNTFSGGRTKLGFVVFSSNNEYHFFDYEKWKNRHLFGQCYRGEIKNLPPFDYIENDLEIEIIQQFKIY